MSGLDVSIGREFGEVEQRLFIIERLAEDCLPGYERMQSPLSEEISRTFRKIQLISHEMRLKVLDQRRELTFNTEGNFK